MKALTHCRPAMPSETKKKNIYEDLSSAILSQFKKISPPWKPEIQLFRHFPKLEIAYFNGENPFNFS